MTTDNSDEVVWMGVGHMDMDNRQADSRQPREHAVPCVWCRCDTWELDAVCEKCERMGRR